MEFTREFYKSLLANKGISMNKAAARYSELTGRNFTQADISKYFVERHYALHQVISLLNCISCKLLLSTTDELFAIEVTKENMYDILKSLVKREKTSMRKIATKLNLNNSSLSIILTNKTIRFHVYDRIITELGYMLKVQE